MSRSSVQAALPPPVNRDMDSSASPPLARPQAEVRWVQQRSNATTDRRKLAGRLLGGHPNKTRSARLSRRPSPDRVCDEDDDGSEPLRSSQTTTPRPGLSEQAEAPLNDNESHCNVGKKRQNGAVRAAPSRAALPFAPATDSCAPANASLHGSSNHNHSGLTARQSELARPSGSHPVVSARANPSRFLCDATCSYESGPLLCRASSLRDESEPEVDRPLALHTGCYAPPQARRSCLRSWLLSRRLLPRWCRTAIVRSENVPEFEF